jgi:RNA polymerase sigma factor (sigma-70 family)
VENKKYRPDYAALYPGVEISDEVMAVLKQSDRKMEYMERDLKRNRFLRDKDGRVIRSGGEPVVLPEREDSLERLTDADWEFPDASPSPEDAIIASEDSERLWQALNSLKPDERALIEALFYERLTEREYGARIGLSQKNVNKRKQKILAKLREYLAS